MNKQKRWYIGAGKKYSRLAPENSHEIEAFNRKMLSVLSLMGVALVLLPLFGAPFSTTKASIVPIYLSGASAYLAVFLLFKLPILKDYTLVGLYIIFSLFFALAVYLSTIHSPHMRATIILGAFCIVPLGYIDRPARINLFSAFWLAVHTLMAFRFKPWLAADDLLNTLIFAILGGYVGNMMVLVRLEGFEAQRLLTIEKETDILTGIFNRRKLFETLAELETPGSKKPDAVLMIDLDNFKEFNDIYGHAAGDACLSGFAKVLADYQRNFGLQFYRYGGDEFVAMAYGFTKSEILSIAESLRIAVASGDFGNCKMTVSIGVAYCSGVNVRNYERIIELADQAAYSAKNSGRNRVCGAQSLLPNPAAPLQKPGAPG